MAAQALAGLPVNPAGGGEGGDGVVEVQGLAGNPGPEGEGGGHEGPQEDAGARQSQGEDGCLSLLSSCLLSSCLGPGGARGG